jgi:HAMP domain-containing protein
MPERIWFRSLYWRVAVGFVAFLAAMLVVQFGVLFWLVARATDEVAGRTPHDLATLVASDIAAAMAAEPLGDPGAYLKEHYGGVTRPVALVMADGRVFVSKDRVELPPPMVEMALRRLRGPRRPAGEGPPAQGGTGRPPGTGVPLPNQPPLGTMGRGFGSGRGIGPGTGMGPGGGMGPGEGMGPGGGPAGQNAPGPRPPGVRTRALGMAPVFHDGQLVAMVIVPPTEHLPTLLREFAPMAAAIGLVLLVVATTLAAIVVFRPAQRRLAALEVAARQLGAGVLTARAPVAGGDEVTSVARAFNAMADELDRRASALIAASETRRQLLADVSHELMTPLTAIRGYLETLQMPELQLDPDARQRYLGIVSAESERLERIIGDLVDLARLEAGGGSLAREDVEVASKPTAADSSRCCRTWRPTLCATRRRAVPSSCGAPGAPTASCCACATPAKASRPSTCRACSTGSTRRTRRGARTAAAAASGSRLRRRLSSATEAASACEAIPAGRRCSRSCCPCPRARRPANHRPRRPGG